MQANTLPVRELQLLELGILVEVDALCKREGLTYYLGEGTLLGAVRHQGFIPWDDDLDILMPRADYERFLQVCNALPATLCVQHHTTTYPYWSPTIKVRLTDNSRFAQQHIAHLTHNNGPYIDIFPLDTVPKQDSKAQRKQTRTFRIWRGILMGKVKVRPLNNLKNIVWRVCAWFVPYARIFTALDRTMTALATDDGAYYVNSGSYYDRRRETAPKEWYGTPRYVPFEDGLYPIPQQAEALLTQIYGDYQTLPPLSERGIHHCFTEDP